ncbi:MAG: ABC transporter permease, partial [Thermoanaerobaculia bacterium]|nr:ABC transporter permease [Thermoanaerobaculia bacterium]
MRQHLFLLKQLVHHDIRGRYAGSIGGFLWSFAHPLFQLVLFWVAFGVILQLKFQLGDLGTDSFAIFLFGGLLPWMAVQEGVNRGATAITDNGTLVQRVRFPPLLLVLSVVVAALVHEAIAALVFLVVLAFVGELSIQTLPWLLLALPLQCALVLGLAAGLSVLQVFLRDLIQILEMVLMGWFYLTPIVYPLSIVPERLRRVLELNPLTGLVELYRIAFLGGRIESVPGLWILFGCAILS